MSPAHAYARRAAGILLTLYAGTHAQECLLPATLPDTVGASFSIKVDCPRPGGSYLWNFGDGSSDSTLQPFTSHVYSKAGQYNILVRVEFDDGNFQSVVGGKSVLHPVTAGRPSQASTLVYDEKRARLWTVNPDNNSVVYLGYPSLARSREFPVGANPRSIARDSAGRIWVCNQDDATLSMLDPESGTVLKTLSLPRASRPYGLALDRARNLLYVTLQATGRLAKVDAASGTLLADLEVVPGARGLAVSQDGRRIFVTRFISGENNGEIAEVDGSAFAVTRRIPIAYDSTTDTDLSGSGVPNALNAIAITPDGREAWFTAKKDNVRRGKFRSGIPFTEENTVRTFFSALDLSAGREIISRRADLDNRNMANAIAFNSNGLYAFVSTLGSNTVDIYNTAGYSRTGSIDPQKLRQELGPQGMLVHPNDSILFVQYFTSREIGVYDLSTIGGLNDFELKVLVKTIDQDRLGDTAARGQQVFYNSSDPRMTRSFYLSCGTCHMDGGSDERVWDFTERGEGLRNTTTLLGKAGTGSGPLHWSANFDEIQDFEHDIRGPQVGYGFLPDALFLEGTRNTTLGDRKAGLSPELDALAAYVSSLVRVPPSPYRNPDGTMTADGIAGKAIFGRPEVGCAKCHKGSGFTDSDLRPTTDLAQYQPFHAVAADPGGFMLHDVGTLKPSSGGRLKGNLPGLDTPPLKGVWATAPYLHDGSAPTLLDVIERLNPEDKHGRTGQLTQTEKQQLIAYLLQLDETDADGNGVRPGPRNREAGDRLAVLSGNGSYRFRVSGNPPSNFRIAGLDGRVVFHRSGAGSWTRDAKGWCLDWTPGKTGRALPGPGLYLAQADFATHTRSLRISLLESR